jgi:uncharacterized protein with LGFP repeats
VTTTALEEATAPQRGLAKVITTVSQRFGRFGRRGFFVGAAMAGSALAVDPKRYALQPVAAYDTICGPGNTAASGWTVFCCTINNGVNSCPPGSFAAGWWKAADSSWCGGGYRYIVDCNAKCTGCTSGCSGDHICDKGCWNCRCGSGSTATCDQRRICCNAFRYGQCNTHVSCSGGVHCRIVSCVAPYKWTNCTTTSLQDNRTKEHSAPCIPRWSSIQSKYDSMGAQGSWLGPSLGPERATADGRGRTVAYRGGYIYWTSATGARAVTNFVREKWLGSDWRAIGYPTSDKFSTIRGGWRQNFEHGCVTDSANTSTQVVYGHIWTIWRREGQEGGELGYPVGPRRTGYRDSGVMQVFEHGCIVDSASTSTQVVWGYRWTLWQRYGRENGVLGYPTGPRTAGLPDGGYIQVFQKGCIIDSASTSTQLVHGYIYTLWNRSGRERGMLGYPVGPRTEGRPDGGVIQLFQKGCIVDSASTTTQFVHGVMFAGWVRAGRETGVLGYPTRAVGSEARGSSQDFQKGELWALGSGAARRVYGAVLSEWKDAGGATGRYGYPVSDTTASGGRLTCVFEGGTITA